MAIFNSYVKLPGGCANNVWKIIGQWSIIGTVLKQKASKWFWDSTFKKQDDFTLLRVIPVTFFWHTFWHFVWHSNWHIFWHSIWHAFWNSLWHTFWQFYLAFYLAFRLTYDIYIYIYIYVPAFLLTYSLTDPGGLSDILSGHQDGEERRRRQRRSPRRWGTSIESALWWREYVSIFQRLCLKGFGVPRISP